MSQVMTRVPPRHYHDVDGGSMAWPVSSKTYDATTRPPQPKQRTQSHFRKYRSAMSKVLPASMSNFMRTRVGTVPPQQVSQLLEFSSKNATFSGAAKRLMTAIFNCEIMLQWKMYRRHPLVQGHPSTEERHFNFSTEFVKEVFPKWIEQIKLALVDVMTVGYCAFMIGEESLDADLSEPGRRFPSAIANGRAGDPPESIRQLLSGEKPTEEDKMNTNDDIDETQEEGNMYNEERPKKDILRFVTSAGTIVMNPTEGENTDESREMRELRDYLSKQTITPSWTNLRRLFPMRIAPDQYTLCFRTGNIGGFREYYITPLNKSDRSPQGMFETQDYAARIKNAVVFVHPMYAPGDNGVVCSLFTKVLPLLCKIATYEDSHEFGAYVNSHPEPFYQQRSDNTMTQSMLSTMLEQIEIFQRAQMHVGVPGEPRATRLSVMEDYPGWGYNNIQASLMQSYGDLRYSQTDSHGKVQQFSRQDYANKDYERRAGMDVWVPQFDPYSGRIYYHQQPSPYTHPNFVPVEHDLVQPPHAQLFDLEEPIRTHMRQIGWTMGIDMPESRIGGVTTKEEVQHTQERHEEEITEWRLFESNLVKELLEICCEKEKVAALARYSYYMGDTYDPRLGRHESDSTHAVVLMKPKIVDVAQKQQQAQMVRGGQVQPKKLARRPEERLSAKGTKSSSKGGERAQNRKMED